MQYKIIAAAVTSILAVGVSALPAANPEAAPDALAAPAPEALPAEHAPLEARADLSELVSAQKQYLQAADAYAGYLLTLHKNGKLEEAKKQLANSKHLQSRSEQGKQTAQCFPNCGGGGSFYRPGGLQDYNSGSYGTNRYGEYINSDHRSSGSNFGLDIFGLPIVGGSANQYSNIDQYSRFNEGENGYYNNQNGRQYW